MLDYIGQKRFPIVIFFIAGILVCLSFPRFISSVKALYSDLIVYELSSGQNLPEATFLKAQANLDEVLYWSDASHYWRQLSQLRFQYFLAYPEKTDNINKALVNILGATDLALSLMPVAPYAWSDRAVMDAMYPEMTDTALTAIKMSVYTDRLNRNLLKTRVLFLWDNKAAWDDESLAIFESQLLLLWYLKRKQLIQVLKSNPEISPWLIHGLSTSPDDLLKLNRLLKKVSQQ